MNAQSSLPEAIALHRQGLHCLAQGDGLGAIAAFNQALRLKPDDAEICFALAETLQQHSAAHVALGMYDYLSRIAPHHAEGKARFFALQQALQRMAPHFRQGNEEYTGGRLEAAVACYEKALTACPRVPEALANMGLALYHLRRFDEAHAAIAEVLRLKPDHAEALNTLGNIYQHFERYDEAIAAYRQAVSLHPHFLNAQANLGKLLQKIRDHSGAVVAYEAALAIDPNHADITVELIHQLHHLCRWEKVEELKKHLFSLLEKGAIASPFGVSLYAPAKLQYENARRWSQKHYPNAAVYDVRRPLPADARKDGKLHIGYLSADFYHHATAFLISELFEHHDRKYFQIHAYSTGKPDEGEEQKRIMRAVDHFHDISRIDNSRVVEQIRADGIDILVDLKGYTRNHRLDLMSARPAPIQIHYLGYPGTMGAVFMDYFIADGITAPEEADAYFSEKLIRLPHSYQINDRKRVVATPKSRAEYGLPADALVFCAFNQSYKITPEIFDAWMRIMSAVPASVLWLYEEHAHTTQTLKREAEKRGVSGQRIITAPFAKQAEHLARYAHADLFLDSFPVCGHTTASDALWCGVPVVTLAGESFISRVAASLLHAVRLPELVASDMRGYEALALSLAEDAGKLAALKKHLREGCLKFPLFDSLATTRALESAYAQTVDYHRNGIAPKAFNVQDRAYG